MSVSSDLLARARARGRARIVLPEGDRPDVQAAAERLRREGAAEPVLIAREALDPARDSRLARVAHFLRERAPERVHDGVHALDLAADPLHFGMALVALGEADGCVAGVTRSEAEILDTALWTLKPISSLVTSVVHLVISPDRVLSFADALVVARPTTHELAEIARQAARNRAAVIGDRPRVVFLESADDRTHRRDVALQFLARSPELSLEPDLDLDALLQAWKEDGTGPAGRELANVLIFPDRAACSLGYRLVRHLGGAAVRGPLLLGLTHPVASLSRGATPDDIVEVVAMVALQAPPT